MQSAFSSFGRAVLRRPPARLPGNLFLTSMPKSGTYLVIGVLTRLYGKAPTQIHKDDLGVVAAINDQIAAGATQRHLLNGHFRYRPNVRELLNPHWRILTTIRDPRDVVLSMRDFLENSTKAAHLAAYAEIAHLSRKEQIKVLTIGYENKEFKVAPIDLHTAGWTDWQKDGGLVVRFEQFWSPETLEDLAMFLGVSGKTLMHSVAATMGRRSPTLNKGVVSRWKSEMDDEIIAFFKSRDGGCVERLGYSWD